jgi:hypothetical protein
MTPVIAGGCPMAGHPDESSYCRGLPYGGLPDDSGFAGVCPATGYPWSRFIALFPAEMHLLSFPAKPPDLVIKSRKRGGQTPILSSRRHGTVAAILQHPHRVTDQLADGRMREYELLHVLDT